MSGEAVSQESGPPPIAVILPLLEYALSGSLLLLRLGFHFLLTITSPLHIPWSIIRVLLAPILTAVRITLDFALFTPFSIIRAVAVALYPVYVFCAAACLFGATVGIFGHYVSTMIQSTLSQSKYFTSRTAGAAPPPTQGMLRKRKRRSVRV